MLNIEIVLILTSLAIIIVIALFIIYSIKKTPNVTVVTQTSNGTTVNGLGQVCGAGQCSVNIQTGAKTCPSLASANIIADPATEACTDANRCDEIRIPYALQSDGSTNINGVCEPNVVCRCLNKPRCANQNTVLFTATNGNVNTALPGQRITITQNVISNSGATGATSTGVAVFPNVVISDPVNQFCTISNSWLQFVSPGTCSELDITIPSNLALCQSRNFCASGTAAFVPRDINTFSALTVNTTPMACVYGRPCDKDHFTVWDNVSNVIRCVPIVP
jgi:hypothetical protein